MKTKQPHAVELTHNLWAKTLHSSSPVGYADDIDHHLCESIVIGQTSDDVRENLVARRYKFIWWTNVNTSHCI